MRPVALALTVIIVLAVACGDERTDTPAPAPTDTPLPAPTAPAGVVVVTEPIKSATNTPVVAVAVEVAPTKSPTPAATQVPAAAPISSHTSTPTSSPTVTQTPSPVPTQPPIAIPAATHTATATSTPIPTPMPTSTSTATPTLGPSPDREALVALYKATGGFNWKNNDNWLTEKPLEEWFGVDTDANNRVIRLNLASNNLSGKIPAELGGLIYLQHLGLGRNRLTEEIPSELGKLASLQYLDLRSNQFSGRIPPEFATLANLEELYLMWNFWSGCIPEDLLGIERTDIDQLRRPTNCTGEVVLTVGEEPLVYNDNVFVLPVPNDVVDLFDYARDRFYEHFDDQFDFLILVNNTYYLEHRCTAVYVAVSNDVRGIGMTVFSRYGLSRLQGMVVLCSFDDIAEGPLLHELMHRWANRIIPPYPHWGFSSAHGQLGGFDIITLVDHGGGRYSAYSPEVAEIWSDRAFATGGYGRNHLPYGPIELYLAGFVPPEEVPDLWMAENGKWLRDESGNVVYTEDNTRMFTASRIKTYTIDYIIEKHGKRMPDSSQAQREFRGAAILLVFEDHPALKWQLDQVSDDVEWFSNPTTDERENLYNFYEATDGRATIEMDGLSQFLRSKQ